MRLIRLRPWLRVACGTVALHAMQARAQHDIENVMVETYYISDASDATDTIGGSLAVGSRTYRVFLDLAAGSKLRAIYGDAGHPLIITSTAPFFNNRDRGKTFGHQVNNNALDENTVALDSWLSMGGASNTRFGIPKPGDTDGSIVGGANNDGGSAAISGGLLVNADADAGAPLTEADGLLPGTTSPLPPNFVVQGLSPDSLLKDSTAGSSFISHDTRIACSSPGMVGATDANTLLIAQLTTTGELTFQLNVEVEQMDGTVIRYVALDTLLDQGETPNGLLSYPPQCGCTDPDFLEYDPAAGCDDGSCTTPIVFGCLDPAACNYSYTANFNVPELCCYSPDSCNGLDITVVCPAYGTPEHMQEGFHLTAHPDPAQEDLFVRGGDAPFAGGTLLLFDLSGTLVRSIAVTASPTLNVRMDVRDLAPGIYFVRALTAGTCSTIPFVKD